MVGILAMATLTGCSEAERVSYNLTQEADNFNVVRQLTVINCIEGDVLFQMTGKMSIAADTSDNQLEIIVEDGGTYVKHFVGLSDNVTYVVEDLNLGANAVSKYKYTLNFNPNMWIPYNVETIDQKGNNNLNTLNENVMNLTEIRVEPIYPLDETKRASYKIVSPDELSYKDFFDATKKLNIDNEISNVIEVITENNVVVRFELDRIKKLKNDKRWIVEWYDGEYYEDNDGNVQERKIGKIHREAFAHKADLLNRLSEFDAINGEINIIDNVYECSLKALTYKDIQEMDEFDEEVED